MSTAYLKLCDLCGLALEGEMRGVRRAENRYNGLVLEVGYSLGGWGYRQSHLKFSGEVCVPCYDRVMVAVQALQRTLSDCQTPTKSEPKSLAG